MRSFRTARLLCSEIVCFVRQTIRNAMHVPNGKIFVRNTNAILTHFFVVVVVSGSLLSVAARSHGQRPTCLVSFLFFFFITKKHTHTHTLIMINMDIDK